MTYIPDLAPYNYYRGAPDGLAVGWLDSAEPFSRGMCPDDIRDELLRLSHDPVRLMRGYHYCQFCEAAAGPRRLLRADIQLYEAPDVARGNGEIWLTGTDSTNFAAPTLIVHYIDEHGYLPPEPFLQAVRQGAKTPGVY